jgi:hypothetical protein
MPILQLNDRMKFDCDRHPDECPVCHRRVHSEFRIGHLIGAPETPRRSNVQAIFLCPATECQSLFIGYYREFNGPHGDGAGVFELTSVAPRSSTPPPIYSGIGSMSKDFTEIYTQATEAENRALNQIAGVGYRKALEFLVKDYCCYKLPGDAEAIKSMMLSPCIEKYVSNEDIKHCAKLATWLGNDETHYVRKWEDKDIEDLKALVSLTMSWIETSIKTDQYRASMLPKAAV